MTIPVDDPVLPPPNELGAPEKFTRWRHRQDQAVLKAASCEERFVMPALPTGAGKSLFYLMVSRLVGGRTVVLTSTKALQQQLMDDFADMGLVEVKGQNAYPCRALIEPGAGHLPEGGAGYGVFKRFGETAAPHWHGGRAGGDDAKTTCDEGPCHYGARCTLYQGGCHYYDAVRTAERSELVVTNYAFWLTTNAYRKREDEAGKEVVGIGPATILVCDEAHDAPAAITSFLTSILDPADVQAILGTDMPVATISNAAWRDWAARWTVKAEMEANALKLAMKAAAGMGTDTRHLRRQLRKVQALLTTLHRLETPGVEWVIEPAIDPETAKPDTRALPRLQFAPLWPGALAEEVLFRGADKVLLVSATVRPKTLDELGVPRDACLFWEEPSPFALARRPVYRLGNVRMRYPETDDVLRWLVYYIDQIIQARPGVRGIIHAASFYRASKIRELSRFSAQMITHVAAGQAWRRGGKSLAEALHEYRTRDVSDGEGAWLLSPSVTTGYDFHGDQCRVQIIAKVPFPDTKAALIKARMKRDPDYTNYQAMQTLVQAVGRPVRSETDWAETFIIDQQIGWLLGTKYQDLSPKWFRDAVREVAVPPAPLSLRFGE